MDARAIATACKPVLLIGTCSILDVMRDPTREVLRINERQAGLDLLGAVEGGTLAGVVTHQVTLEFAENDRSVQDDADRALKKLRGQIERLNQLSEILGAPGQLNLAHLDDHVVRTRKVVERWLKQLAPLPARPHRYREGYRTYEWQHRAGAPREGQLKGLYRLSGNRRRRTPSTRPGTG